MRLIVVVAMVAACKPSPAPERGGSTVEVSGEAVPSVATTASTTTRASVATTASATTTTPSAAPHGQCAPPFPESWQFDNEDRAAREHLNTWAWLKGESREHVIVSPVEDGHDDARCYAFGPHVALNVANWCCRASKAIGVRALRKKAPLTAGAVHHLRGHVVKRYRCPPCPAGARCKPCMGDNIVISDDSTRHEIYDLDEGDTIVFTADPDRFELGAKVTVSVAVLGTKQSNAPLNDLHLVAWR